MFPLVGGDQGLTTPHWVQPAPLEQDMHSGSGKLWCTACTGFTKQPQMENTEDIIMVEV